VVLLLFFNSDKVRVRVYHLGAYLNSVGFEELLGEAVVTGVSRGGARI
jgi:hypothetical protein